MGVHGVSFTVIVMKAVLQLQIRQLIGGNSKKIRN